MSPTSVCNNTHIKQIGLLLYSLPTMLLTHMITDLIKLDLIVFLRNMLPSNTKKTCYSVVYGISFHQGSNDSPQNLSFKSAPSLP